MSSVRRRETCRLCGSRAFTRVIELTPTPPANAFVAEDQLAVPQPCYPLDVFFCEDCAHVQLLDVVDPAVLFEDYVYVSGTSPVFVEHLRGQAESVVDRFGLGAGDLAVDIGSNDGTALRAYLAHGLSVLGVDPARDIAEQANASGIETMVAFFTPEIAEDIRAERGPAAVISANNVFAHVDDLSGFADGVRRLLAPGGVFVFEVSYLLDVFEKNLFDTIYHEHLAYHSVGPLKRFLERHGLQLFDAVRVAPHGGSLRGYVQLHDGPHLSTGAVEELIAAEVERGIDRAETFRTFAANIDSLKDQLGSLLRGLKGEGKALAGFGAPAKATTLMYHFGLGGDVLDFVVDDSPLKQGLFTPGLHIPVLPSSAIYERRPDYVLLLAWNFAEPIISKHQAFLDAGGHFIVPSPKVEVI